MNIHVDGNLSLPFDENQTIGVRKSGLKHSLQSSDGGFPVKSKGLGGSAVKKQRKALGDVSASQINARQKGTRSNNQDSKLNISVSKPSAKVATSTIFVQKAAPLTDHSGDMACSGTTRSHQRDLQLEVDRMAAKKCSSMISKPGLSYPPSDNIGVHKSLSSSSSSSSFSSSAHMRAEAAAILNETTCAPLMFIMGEESSATSSFLSEILDDQSINDLLND